MGKKLKLLDLSKYIDYCDRKKNKVFYYVNVVD